MVATYPIKPKAQDTTYLRSVWETINYISCPYSFNFHMHTTASDGKLKPSSLVQQAIDIGLQGFAITDHHSVNGYREAEQYLAQLSEKDSTGHIPHLWTGVEITSRLLDVEVHILGYGFDPEHPSISSYLEGDKPEGERAAAKRVIKSIKEAGGLVVLAHPERYRRSSNQLIPAVADLGIDGLETYYAYNNPKIWQPSPRRTKKVQEFAEK
ncbi:MAG: PHP domain-containing protein [Pleurocapsa sp.]